MAPDCLRLVYASRATFTAGTDNATVNADVARILMQSRRNNPPSRLVGALYFADGCFFQCLEGPAEAVDALYARLHDDPRHRDLAVLQRTTVARTSFAGWSMKFVPNATAVRDLLRRHGLSAFDPYHFPPAALADMVQLLVAGSDAGNAGAAPPSVAATASAPAHAAPPVRAAVSPSHPAPAGAAPTDAALATARQARVLASLALAASVISVGVVLAR